jgi:hypothetical protein
MTDQEFIGYCELHSSTERRLFSAEHIGRLAKLAGKEVPADLRGWYSIDLSDWCKAARDRL